MSNETTQSDIDQLNSFLRGEISAVETYEQAIEATDHGVARQLLRENQASHAKRITLLSGQIAQLGGTPAAGSGPWGTFAKAVEGGAKLFGESAAIAALEEGEEHGLKDYRSDFDALSMGVREMVVGQLIPAQQRTHQAISRLREIID
jgi:hypothetical protein